MMTDEEGQGYQLSPIIADPPLDYQALAEFRYLIRRFLAFSEAMARSKGLTPQQHQAMLAIAGCKPGTAPTIGYLAERLAIKHHSAVGLVDRLVQQGLVEREPGATDRRQVLVRLTPKGAMVLADLSAGHQAEIRSFGPQLVDALSAVIGGITSPTATHRPLDWLQEDSTHGTVLGSD